ncbi:MAG TPA: hypothetical protein VJU77_02115 [Chthoniobacterales bacterium]|nr:hypothetical protein [Chthoniobacterales bacterium]
MLADKGFEAPWRRTLWVVVVTLWFVWPLVLLLHRGRSVARWTLFVLLGLVLLVPSLRFYNFLAPEVFGLPLGVGMDPVSLSYYCRAYLTGRAEAKKDIAAGVFVIEAAGFGAGRDPTLWERYHVDVRAIAGCLVDNTILGHLAGYNAISEPEIYRRFGRDKIEAAREESYQIARATGLAWEQRQKDLAKQLTSLPPDSNLILKSISPYCEQHPDLTPDIEEGLQAFVHSIEQFITPLIPKDAPAFDLHISASLARSTRPKFETSGSLSIPREIYDAIYKEIPNLPFAEWVHDDLSVSLDFCTE